MMAKCAICERVLTLEQCQPLSIENHQRCGNQMKICSRENRKTELQRRCMFGTSCLKSGKLSVHKMY
mgnify:CR=1 FL=1